MDDNTPDTPELEKLFEKLGKIYLSKGGNYYILAQIGYCNFTMVELNGGNRMCDGLETLDELTEGMIEVPGAKVVVRFT